MNKMYLDLSNRENIIEVNIHREMKQLNFVENFKINEPMLSYDNNPEDFLKINFLDNDILAKLINRNPYKVKYISHLITDYDLQKLSVELYCDNIFLFSKISDELLLIAIQQNGNCISAIPKHKQTIDLVIQSFMSDNTLSWLHMISEDITNDMITEYFKNNIDVYNIIKKKNPNNTYFNDCSKFKNVTVVKALYKDYDSEIVGAILSDNTIIDICSFIEFDDGDVDSLRKNWNGSYKIFKKNKKVYNVGGVGEDYLKNLRNLNGVKSKPHKDLLDYFKISY